MVYDNAALVRRFYGEMWNRFDHAMIPELLDVDFAFRGSLGTETRGHAEFAGYMDAIRAAFPDFCNEIVEMVSEGDRVFARLRYTGTHRGEILGIAATGKRIEYAGAALFTIRGGKIASAWVLGDVYGLLRQLQAED